MTWRPARTRCMRGTSAPPRSCGKSRSPPRERRGSSSSSTRAASAGCPTRTSTAKTIPRMPATSVIRVPRLGLGAKIFVAATVSVAAVLGVTLGLTSLQANRTADAAIRRALAGVRRGVQAFLSGRTATFAGMSAVSAQVPQFRERLLRGSERGNVLDQAEEYRQLLGAAWVLVTDDHGILVARTDYPTETDIDLSRGALVANALSGEPTNGAWLDDRLRRLFEAVAVPLRASANAAPQGVLIAAYAVDDSLAQAIKQATTTDVVFFALDSLDRPYIVGSTLPREEVEPALVADTAAIGALGGGGGGGRDSTGTEFTADVGGERLIGLASPLRSAGGDVFGGFITFRSHDRELAGRAPRAARDALPPPVRRLAGRRPPARHPVRQPLRGEGAARHGRHGRGVPRVRPRATGARGDQDAPARGARRRRRGARALQAGDPPGAQDRPPQRGADVRPGRSERAVLSHDGVRGGHVAQAADRHARPAPRPRGADDRQAAVPGARGGARTGRDPPRHQAAEHRGGPDGLSQGDGLRHCAARDPGDRQGPDAGRDVDRHAGLHVAGAAVGVGARRAQRSLFGRRRPVRVPDRAGPVRGRIGVRLDREAPRAEPAGPADAQFRGARGAGAGDSEGHGERTRRPVPECGSDARCPSCDGVRDSTSKSRQTRGILGPPNNPPVFDP